MSIMKKLLFTHSLLFLTLSFFLFSCCIRNSIEPVVDYNIFDDIGATHNEALDLAYESIVSYKNEHTDNNVCTKDLYRAAMQSIQSVCSDYHTKSSEYYTWNDSINVSNSECFFQVDSVIFRKYTEIFDRSTSLEEVVTKLKDWSEEVELSALDHSCVISIKSGIAVALSSIEYWKVSYQKWYNVINIEKYSKTKAGTETLKGSVRDSSGEPVIGATIYVKGTKIGAVSDIDGNFQLNGITGRETICVSFIGLKTQEIKVKDKRTVLIVLQEDVSDWWKPIAATAKEDGIGAVAAAAACMVIGPFDAGATALGAMVASLTYCLQNI